jgi:NADPH2:quinone reductase
MKAVVLHAYSDLSKNLTVDTRPLPILKPGQVLVRMAAAAINPSDLVFLQQQYGIQKALPVVPGFEGSGTVIAANAGLYGRWLIGRRVAARAPEDGDGTWADYMSCHAAACVPLKSSVSLEEGATLLVNPLTAWLLLQKVTREGHRAFVQTGASSAVGRMIARLAKRLNIPAIHIVRRAESAEELRQAGAEHVLDSSAPDFSAALKALAHRLRATLALDAVGGSLSAVVAAALPRGGQVTVYGALGGEACAISPTDLIFQQKSLTGFWLTDVLRTQGWVSRIRALSRVQDLLASELSTRIHTRLPLENIHEAFRLYKAHRSEGKVLLVFN